MDVLKRLFEGRFHTPVLRVEALQGQLGGSGRSIVRLIGENLSVIGIVYDVREENVAFIEFSSHFRQHGLPVPEIYAEDLDHGAYLEEDLGNSTLFEFLSQNRAGEEIARPALEAYRQALSFLPRFQIEAGRDLNYKVCYPRASFDRQSIAWDLNYFKYYFLRLAGIPFNEQALEHDFGRLTKFLLTAPREYFLYRDFQSRNVMLRDGKPFFLDYQGGRKGALQYDIASLLFDAKADLPPTSAPELLDHYLGRLAGFIELDREAFMRHYYAYVYVRIMQALGAYGFRGFYERKPHFLQSVPYALKNVRWLLHNVELPIPLPTLMEAFSNMVASEKLQNLGVELLRQRAAANSRPGRWWFGFSVFPFTGACRKMRAGMAEDSSSMAGPCPIQGGKSNSRRSRARDAPVIEYLNRQESVRAGFSLSCGAGGRERDDLSAAAVQESYGVIRVHRRTASFSLFCGATGQASAREAGAAGGSETPGAGEDGQMKAMILAAGLGTRLRPLTDSRPKALVEVAGRTLLEITLARLREFGISDVIINAHHFANMICDYLERNQNFGMNLVVSAEDALLDTGGGLKKAAYFFLENSEEGEPFLLHNVDVISTIDFRRMVQFHQEHQALATLAVQERKTSRYLLFAGAELCGRRVTEPSKDEMVRPARDVQALAFCGVHVISNRFLRMMSEQGSFSIIAAYLRLAGMGEKIVGYRADEFYWRDVGRLESVAQATEDIQRKTNLT